MAPKEILRNINVSFNHFLRLEASSGILLIAATMMALILANSPLGDSYFSFFDTRITVGVGGGALDKPLILWINDGLMALFFLLVGLEMKREILVGELSSLREAALPSFAALGGMIVPAVFFALIHGQLPGKEAWAVPMATDIAFALGVLILLGKGVPIGLKVFLTALAIVDDLGAILVIAVFYTTDLDTTHLLYAAGYIALLILLNRMRIRSAIPYLFIGALLWYSALKTGIHPTIAGVITAFTIPIRLRIRDESFLQTAQYALDKFSSRRSSMEQPLLQSEQVDALDALEQAVSKVQPTLQKLEHRLHGSVAYVIVPLFALANAGIVLIPDSGSAFGALSYSVAASLVLGKSLGIMALTWLCWKLGLGVLPEGVRFVHILGVSFLAGIGFTMAIFVANLGLEDPALLAHAKSGIIAGSIISGLAGYFILRGSLSPSRT
jgi:NhaA family Na+:H+ antiporter